MKTLRELAELAKVPEQPAHYTVKTWCTTAQRLFDQSVKAYDSGAVEDAWVALQKYCCIIKQVVPKHPDFARLAAKDAVTYKLYTNHVKSADSATSRLNKLRQLLLIAANGSSISPEASGDSALLDELDDNDAGGDLDYLDDSNDEQVVPHASPSRHVAPEPTLPFTMPAASPLTVAPVADVSAAPLPDWMAREEAAAEKYLQPESAPFESSQAAPEPAPQQPWLQQMPSAPALSHADDQQAWMEPMLVTPPQQQPWPTQPQQPMELSTLESQPSWPLDTPALQWAQQQPLAQQWTSEFPEQPSAHHLVPQHWTSGPEEQTSAHHLVPQHWTSGLEEQSSAHHLVPQHRTSGLEEQTAAQHLVPQQWTQQPVPQQWSGGGTTTSGMLIDVDAPSASAPAQPAMDAQSDTKPVSTMLIDVSEPSSPTHAHQSARIGAPSQSTMLVDVAAPSVPASTAPPVAPTAAVTVNHAPHRQEPIAMPAPLFEYTPVASKLDAISSENAKPTTSASASSVMRRSVGDNDTVKLNRSAADAVQQQMQTSRRRNPHSMRDEFTSPSFFLPRPMPTPPLYYPPSTPSAYPRVPGAPLPSQQQPHHQPPHHQQQFYPSVQPLPTHPQQRPAQAAPAQPFYPQPAPQHQPPPQQQPPPTQPTAAPARPQPPSQPSVSAAPQVPARVQQPPPASPQTATHQPASAQHAPVAPAVPPRHTYTSTPAPPAAGRYQPPVVDRSTSFVPTPSMTSTSQSLSYGVVGMRNLGNTCYMNATLQCLSTTLLLTKHFRDGTYRRYINRNNPLGSGGKIAEAYSELLRTIWSNQQNVVSPHRFKDVIGDFSSQFVGFDQHDAQEFLAFLLDGLHEDMNIGNKSIKLSDPDSDGVNIRDADLAEVSWHNYLQRNHSTIVTLFQGQYKSVLTCAACSHQSVSFNTFMFLSIPVPTTSRPVTLDECLQLFTEKETLHESDGWRCPKCRAVRSATKQLQLWRMPAYLLIHLKRFASQGMWRTKIDTHVNFPLRNLDVSPHVGNAAPPVPKYDLYAVTNHYGGLNGGHYTAFCQHMFLRKWHLCDDSHVSVVPETAVQTRAAYILFFASQSNLSKA